jgi:2-polyprenyl-3-methyl-5-hydroxy-6-metoxy-1,4-benzoquinol methylase
MKRLFPEMSSLLGSARFLWEWLCRLDETEKARVFLEHLPYLLDDHQDVNEMRHMTDVMLSHAESREAYEAIYEEIWEANPPASLEAIEAGAAQLPRYPWTLRMLQEAGCKYCIDLGSGSGSLVLYLAAHGIEATGINLTTRCVEAANAVAQALSLPCRFFRDDAEHYRTRELADAVCAFEILEHVICPMQLIANMESNVRAGGLLLLTTPEGSTTIGCDTWFERNYRIAIPHTHLRAYTERRLRELLGNRCDLKIERQESAAGSGVPLLAASWRDGG